MKFYLSCMVTMLCAIGILTGLMLPDQYHKLRFWIMVIGAGLAYLNAIYIYFILQKDLAKDVH